MEGVGSLVSLEHLWMGKNKITEVSKVLKGRVEGREGTES